MGHVALVQVILAELNVLIFFALSMKAGGREGIAEHTTSLAYPMKNVSTTS